MLSLSLLQYQADVDTQDIREGVSEEVRPDLPLPGPSTSALLVSDSSSHAALLVPEESMELPDEEVLVLGL